jgi:uncharacterized protein involved in type VI secretion and phage assembly
MSLDAGGNGYGKGPASRGFSFIPELKDSVLVSFLNPQQLAQPFVMGSMFHGANAVKLGGGKGNHIKNIITRSGHTIEFNDNEQGNWGITVKDKNGNMFFMDTKEKNITITTPETLTLNSKYMNINVLKDMTINVQENWLEQVSGNKTRNVGKDEQVVINKDLVTEAKSITSKSVRKTLLTAGDKMEQVAKEITVHSNQGEIVIDGTGKVTIQSKDRIDYGE